MDLQRDATPRDAVQRSGTLRITVPWDIGRTSRNRLDGRDWRTKRARYNAARDTAGWAWVAAGKPRVEGRVRVSVIVRRARAMDPDGVWGALKPVIDGLFKRAITPDDSRTWLELGTVSQSIDASWKGREECEFLVEPAEAR